MKAKNLLLAVLLFSPLFWGGIGGNVFAQYTNLYNISPSASDSNGSTPYGSLISDGTFLYGMTCYGGTINFGNYGIIFKIMPDGTGFSKLLEFDDSTNGRNPYGSLISDGTFLYGMTSSGGTNGAGVIFKIMPDGTGFSKLLDFGGVANGRVPYGDLIYVGGFLYGMTFYGGAYNLGSLFKIMPDGTGYSDLLDFDYTKGSYPWGSLISDGTFLYGMTQNGGANDAGVLFKIQLNGTGYSKLLDFGGAANGSNPEGSLILDGGFLYGITQNGGTNNLGTIFKIMPNGTGYYKLLDFDSINGSNPTSSLVSNGGFLYGTTFNGGTNNTGVLFKIKSDGTGYSNLHNFVCVTGFYPFGSLISDGNLLYGMTVGGYPCYTNRGTIFKYGIATGIAENNSGADFTIYPNPTSDKITITSTGSSQKQTLVSIYNMQRQIILSASFQNKNTIELDVSALSKGIYLIKIQSENGVVNRKLVIQ